MIYQCYHHADQVARLFTTPVYRGFGLEPSLNPDLIRRCPELASETNRRFLNEYGAMLNLWRNGTTFWPRWIGFTSYRQRDKTPFQFQSARQVRAALNHERVVAWGCMDVSAFRVADNTGAAAQLEHCHPGGLAYLERALAEFGLALPERFQTDAIIAYANYWVMRKRDFADFMEFSWPPIEWMLRTQDESGFVASHPRSIGYIVERMFIVWYMQRGLAPARIGPLSLG